jgi:transposase InsO family protein
LVFIFYKRVQNGSEKVANILNFYKKHRKSSKGNYWTNAIAESFLKYWKPELIYGNK